MLVWLDPQEKKDDGGQLVNQGKGGREVQMELEGEEVQEGPLESQEKRVLPDKMAPQDLLENRDLKDHREDTVNQDQEGLMVHQEKMDCPVILDRGGNQASKARMVHLAPQVLLGHRANQGRLGQLETEAIQVHQDHRENMVYQELLERRVPRGMQVHQEHLEKVALLGSKALEGSEEPLVQWVLQD